MTNITFDFFGHSVNLLEIGGRIEGLEYFLESYFGPNGYFQNNDLPMQSVHITTNVVSVNPSVHEVYSVQHYVTKFASDLRQVGSFTPSPSNPFYFQYNFFIPFFYLALCS
jgi:hypothetical protein